MRLLGLICLVSAGFGAGKAICAVSHRNCACIAHWMQMLEQIRYALSLYSAPMEDIAGMLAAESTAFALLQARLQNGYTLRDCWEEILDAEPENPSALKEALLPLGRILGSCRTEDQLDAIGVTLERLRRLHDEETGRCRETQRLALRLGPVLGAITGILLL